MTMKVYSVYDSKVGAFMAPFFARSKGEATRMWHTAVNDPQTQFCKFPSDFTLFEIGEYDELTGDLIAHKAKESVGLALEFKDKPEDKPGLLDIMKGKAN